MNSASETKGPSPLDAKLDSLFDSLRGKLLCYLRGLPVVCLPPLVR